MSTTAPNKGDLAKAAMRTRPPANETTAPMVADPNNDTPVNGSSAAPTNATTPMPTTAPANMTTKPMPTTTANESTPMPTSGASAAPKLTATTMPAANESTPVPTSGATVAPKTSTVSPTNAPIDKAPVYNCNCTMDSPTIATARDLVTYAGESNLLPALGRAVRDGKNPDVLALVACGGADDIAAVLSLTPSAVDDLCKKPCAKGAHKQNMYMARRQQQPMQPAPVQTGTPTARVIPSQMTARRDYNVVPPSPRATSYNSNNVNSNNRQRSPNGNNRVPYVSRRRSTVASVL